MSESEEPVKYQVENKNVTNLNTSGNGILRIAASPLNIKTQIAKISYNNNSGYKTPKRRYISKQPSNLNEENIPTEPELRTVNTNQMRTREKEEPVEEQKSRKTYLNETTNKSTDKCRLSVNGIQLSDMKENCSSETVPIFGRSKTDLVGKKLGSESERRQKMRGGAKIRSKSCRLPETKSDEILPPVTEKIKRKSYNVEEARKFLEDQQRRRRTQKVSSTLKLGNENTNFEKEQIKKRLEELRKNSRAIITKNVNRKKSPALSQINIKSEHKKVSQDEAFATKNEYSLKKEELSKKSTVILEDCSNLFNDDTGNNEKSIGAAKIANEPGKQNVTRVSRTHEEKNESPHSPYLHNKRIGLLRKQETKDHSFSAIREFSFDKENIALEMMTPKLRESVPLETKTVSKRADLDAQRNDLKDKAKDITYRMSVNMTTGNDSQSKQLKTAEISKRNGINSIQESSAKSHTQKHDKVETIPQKDLPYWLKPSTVQIYPYNFIMAVRRKLEALADVRTQPTEVNMEATKDIPLENTEKGEIFLSKGTGSTCSGEFSLTHNVIPSSSKANCIPSHSEINSDLSSISIQLRSSNTVSESSTKKTKSIPLTYAKSKVSEEDSEDDTTISSSIFNSADKNIHAIKKVDRIGREELQGTISPLSLERVENLTIMSNKKLKRAIAISHVNTNRGDASPIHKENATYIDFNLLLHDFNNSLSQVIEVNDRLKATINKSREICGSIRTESSNSKQSDQYSAHFEKNCSDQSITSLGENIDINPQIKGTYEIQNKGKDRKLESGELGLRGSEDCPSKDSNTICKSCTNSSLSSWNSNVCNDLVGLSQQELDKRLHKIRNIKEKYKQIIINLQRNRNKSDYCMEREIIGSNVQDEHTQSEGIKEEFECAESPAQSITPQNDSEQKENEIFSKRIEEEVDKTNSEIQQQQVTLKPLHFISEKKSPILSLRSQNKSSNHHFASQNISTNRKILEMFDHTHLEISMGSTNNDSLSDSTCSYSNVGLYEKLIRNETIKSEHLTALLKMRERALFDRTKGQIAWLEVQKERCKSKGLLLQIATIKKKQRGILLKMEKERDEIKRLLQSTTTTNSTESTSHRELKELVSPIKKSIKSVVSEQTNSKLCHKFTRPRRRDKRLFSESATADEYSKRTQSNVHDLISIKNPRSDPVLRANYDLESSRSLENLLRKREIDLQRRREHVERLMQWHRRLDQEESEVLQMEDQLLTYNAHKIQSKTRKVSQNHPSVVSVKNHYTHTKVQRRLNEIENSLRKLNNISSTSTGSNDISGKKDGIECVHTTGIKLNKLWRRLTSQHCEKYEPNMYYNLSKSDLERLYEAAKVAVLQDFSHHEGGLAADLIEKCLLKHNNVVSKTVPKPEGDISIPSLNLSTSSELSDKDVSWEETSAHSVLIGKYSPSSAAEKFNQFPENSATGTACSTVNELSSEDSELLKDNALVLNVGTIMRSLPPKRSQLFGLTRSLSDTVLYNKNRSPHTNENDTEPQDDAKSYISNMANVAECKELSPFYSKVSKETRYSTSTSTGLNHQNGCERIDEKVSVKPSQKPEINEKLITCSEEQVFQSSSQINSKSLHSISGSELNSIECKTSSSMDKLQNDNCISTSNISDLNMEESARSQNSFNSKTFICKEKLMEIDEISNEDLSSKIYEDDFENNSELTQLNNVSFPYFESIVDLSLPEANDDEEKQESDSQNLNENTNVNKETPILSEVSAMPENSPPQKSSLEILSVPSQLPTSSENANLPTQQISSGGKPSTVQLMPDIINELEIRRCQQILLETEQIKQFENTSTVPYMYVREIPNKPPPPYVPPAHGSPMTTIFPSEERIKEISYRRTHELYCELQKTEYISECGKKLPSVMDEKITNIYERIILDICREYLDEHSEVLTQGDPVNFHNQLAFFNPPNRLQCIQESVYKEVRRCLAMNKAINRRTPVYSVYGQRANSDHIGKIIIQEMYDEDDKWCNFHREENEVIELIIYEVIEKCISNIAEEVLDEESRMTGYTNRNEAKTNENIDLCLDTSEQPNDSEEMPTGQKF